MASSIGPTRGSPVLTSAPLRRPIDVNMFNFRFTAATVALLGALALPSCSTYRADFAQAVANAEVPPNSPAGPWEGRWKSAHNGHEGPLWCLITPTPDTPGSYDFRYRAGWGRLQFGDYMTTVKPKGTGATWTVEDSLDLPGGFGTYSIKGTITPTKFTAAFKADQGDHGKMTLTWPQ